MDNDKQLCDHKDCTEWATAVVKATRKISGIVEYAYACAAHADTVMDFARKGGVPTVDNRTGAT